MMIGLGRRMLRDEVAPAVDEADGSMDPGYSTEETALVVVGSANSSH